MNIHHWFLPHKETHQKAKLISWEGMLIFILLFILLQVSFSIVGIAKPGILGTSSTITAAKIIQLTNAERAQVGLNPVVENSVLDAAAQLKAQNMFAENYWAHFAPSGKTPWDFILGSGYKFSFAGENLAKSFQSDQDVVSAWIASSPHKENLLNPKYQDIGIAVEDGVINGQKTTLVVQMFAAPAVLAANPQLSAGGKKIELKSEEIPVKPQLVAAVQTAGLIGSKPLINPSQVTKSLGFMAIFFISLLLVLDFISLKRRGVARIGSHHLIHVAFLSVSIIIVLIARPGGII